MPPSTRRSLSHTFSMTYRYTAFGGRLAGKLAWVVTTSALLVGLPYALAVETEAAVVQQEREFAQQQSGAQVSQLAEPSIIAALTSHTGARKFLWPLAHSRCSVAVHPQLLKAHRDNLKKPANSQAESDRLVFERLVAYAPSLSSDSGRIGSKGLSGIAPACILRPSIMNQNICSLTTSLSPPLTFSALSQESLGAITQGARLHRNMI